MIFVQIVFGDTTVKTKHSSTYSRENDNVIQVKLSQITAQSEQTQNHLNVCAADGATTTLTFHLVGARLTKALVATWDKRDTRIALCDEADFAVVAVGGWCGDGRDDGVCVGVSIIS